MFVRSGLGGKTALNQMKSMHIELNLRNFLKRLLGVRTPIITPARLLHAECGRQSFKLFWLQQANINVKQLYEMDSNSLCKAALKFNVWQTFKESFW